MHDLLEKLGSGEAFHLIMLVVAIVAAIVAIVGIVARCIHSIRRDATNAALKQDMLDRGMSADEIKVVLEAGTGK